MCRGSEGGAQGPRKEGWGAAVPPQGSRPIATTPLSPWVGQGIMNLRRDLPALPGQAGKRPQPEQERVAPRTASELTPGGPATSKSLSCSPAGPVPSRRACGHLQGGAEQLGARRTPRWACPSLSQPGSWGQQIDILELSQTLDTAVFLPEVPQGPPPRYLWHVARAQCGANACSTHRAGQT